MKLFKLLFILSLFTLTACSSYGPKKQSSRSSSDGHQLDLEDSVVTRPPEKIDLNQLQKNLNLSYPRHSLGLFEKSFNTCEVGAGFYPDFNCRTRTLSVVHYKVSCRNTNGTVSSLSGSDLKPLSHANTKWKLRRRTGRVRLDYRGVGEALIVSKGSIANERFIILHKSHYLGQRTKDIDKIVVPKDWCRF